jgi:four helix bundle protein
MDLAIDVYRVCLQFPRDERFALAAQLKRAAISIPSNIAEGSRRRRRQPFALHLEIALGSQAEVEVQLELAKRLGFVAESDCHALRERVARLGRMLNRLIDHHRGRTTHHSLPTTHD